MTALTEVAFPHLPKAACAGAEDPDAFFPFRSGSTEQARQFCRRCPEIRPCLAWALNHREAGIWAGTTEPQRDQLARTHRRTA